jgi:membrane-associated PAP2 superfamily phosphatase
VIELILGIVALVIAIACALLVGFAASMSDSPSSTHSFVSSSLWTIFIVWAVIEGFLFFLWFAKSKGWS